MTGKGRSRRSRGIGGEGRSSGRRGGVGVVVGIVTGKGRSVSSGR